MSIVHPTASAWPLQEYAEDEWAADEWLPDPSSYESYQKWTDGALSEAAYQEADQRFMDRYRAILRGEIPMSSESLSEEAEALSVELELTHDWRSPLLQERGISDEKVAQFAEDYVPDAPLLMERFLGPYAEHGHRALHLPAMAQTALLLTMANEGSPALRFRNARPRPDVVDRKAVGALIQSPAMLWDADWNPLLPLYESWRPTGKVHAAPVPLRPEQPGSLILARLVHHMDGSCSANMAISVPSAPSAGWLTRRMRLELLRLRRHDRRANWETVLRTRSEVLYRSCAIWNWTLENPR